MKKGLLGLLSLLVLIGCSPKAPKPSLNETFRADTFTIEYDSDLFELDRNAMQEGGFDFYIVEKQGDVYFFIWGIDFASQTGSETKGVEEFANLMLEYFLKSYDKTKDDAEKIDFKGYEAYSYTSNTERLVVVIVNDKIYILLGGSIKGEPSKKSMQKIIATVDSIEFKQTIIESRE